MLMAVWNDETRTLQIANAGSVQPVYVTNSVTGTPAPAVKRGSKDTVKDCVPEDGFNVKTIEVEGFPLGLFPDAQYDEQTIEAKPGDVLVFFSDGIVDAENAAGEMFGADRLSEVLRQHPSACNSAQATVDAILAEVNAFQSGTAHFDDETLVVLRVL
jgi:sigma-B regulation protein RsbU (phosphoserine phosphatase)